VPKVARRAGSLHLTLVLQDCHPDNHMFGMIAWAVIFVKDFVICLFTGLKERAYIESLDTGPYQHKSDS